MKCGGYLILITNITKHDQTKRGEHEETQPCLSNGYDPFSCLC